MDFLKQRATLIAIIGIAIFGVISFLLASTNSLTFDERAHIPAGYSYVRYGDIRLNPEHPPFLKDLAGLPLLFLQPQFPLQSEEWINGPNEQWEIGSMFLNCTRPELACNDTFALTFWSRAPFVFVSLALAFFLFRWTRKISGPLAGLMALALMIGDPNMLAHNHLVTTDVGIAAFLFFVFYFFLEFLKNPSWKNTWLLAVFFTLVQLVKFSAVLLFPLFGFFILTYALFLPIVNDSSQTRWKIFLQYVGKSLFVLAFYAVVVYVVYFFHTLTTPVSHILGTAYMMFPERALGPLARAIVEYTSSIDILKPYAAYLLGVLMVFGRVAGGNTHYFLGSVQADAQMSYFPVVFFAKETVPFILLLVVSVFYATFRGIRSYISPPEHQQNTFKARFFRHIDSIVIFSFVLMYSLLSIFGNLNIGFRHLFPIIPFLYLWIAKTIWTMLKDPRLSSDTKKIAGVGVSLLIFIQILIPFLHYPYYLPYYNELAGGTKQGYLIATDSNYDWGQDLGRLEKFVSLHNYCVQENIQRTLDCSLYRNDLPPIDKIRVDYFGGENPSRVLGDVYEGWWSERPQEPGWYAISINTLQENWTTHTNMPSDKKSYLWLKQYEPVARAGQSIFIYYIP